MVCASKLCQWAVDARARLLANSKIPPSAIFLLVLTAAISLFWSNRKQLLHDEFFTLWTDSASSIGEVAHIQRTCPVALDPLVYHALAHAAIQVFGAGAFAIRLPSLLGFLLMQICLFVFVRRIAGERAGVFALGFPMLTGAFFYSAEGRPYGLLLGFFGLAIVSWQAATRRETKRTVALIMLAVAIALALNTHYFGVLLLAPLCAAEFFRCFQRRRLDFPVLASIGAGAAGILFVLPLMQAAAQFRGNFLDHGRVYSRMIGRAFNEMLVVIPLTDRGGAIFLIFIALSAMMVLWSCLRQIRAKTLQLPGGEAVLLIMLAALPFFGYMLACSVTHSMRERYVLGAVIGITALLAAGLSPLFRRDQAWNDTLTLLFLSVITFGAAHILQGHIATAKNLSILTVTPEIKAALLASPTQLIYFQDVEEFGFASYYEPDPDIRSHLAYVYSRDQEIRWSHQDTASLNALHMRNFTHFIIVPYESLTTQPGNHIFVNYIGMDWAWTDQAFTAAHANVRLIGSAFDGQIVAVRFLP
jgi:hypothetical protein